MLHCIYNLCQNVCCFVCVIKQKLLCSIQGAGIVGSHREFVTPIKTLDHTDVKYDFTLPCTAHCLIDMNGILLYVRGRVFGRQ